MVNDTVFIQKCIDLSKESVSRGESPFGSVITLNGKIIAQSGNNTVSSDDAWKHSEMLVMFLAKDILKKSDLCGCTLYTNCEPCPMCAFMSRELKISRVVYSLSSPYMGGHSKWNILEDCELEKFAPVFAQYPIVEKGLLTKEALDVFHAAGWGEMFKK